MDTGASFSLVPHSSKDPPSGPKLVGPAGGDIKCWGKSTIQLRFSGRTFQWPFLRAAVSFPILGVDFLIANRLLVDAAGNRLLDAATGDALLTAGRPSGPTASVVLPAATPSTPPLLGPGPRKSPPAAASPLLGS